jgi:class 3 adenylate cyclase
MCPAELVTSAFAVGGQSCCRTGASPQTAARALLRTVLEVDLRPLLPLIQAPTLVLHRREFHVPPVEHAHFLVEHIPDARLLELPGADMSVIWDRPELALDAIEEFLTGVRSVPQPNRVLATVLFTDIVGSTEWATRLGDRRWRELLTVHDELARRLIEEFGGQFIKTTGDGRGIRCAAALRDELRSIGLQIRVGLHAGEVELRDGDVGGVAVHIAARVMAAASPGEVVTSRTVRDLIVGSDIAVEDRGEHVLKGIDGSWQLYAVSQP